MIKNGSHHQHLSSRFVSLFCIYHLGSWPHYPPRHQVRNLRVPLYLYVSLIHHIFIIINLLAISSVHVSFISALFSLWMPCIRHSSRPPNGSLLPFLAPSSQIHTAVIYLKCKYPTHLPLPCLEKRPWLTCLCLSHIHTHTPVSAFSLHTSHLPLQSLVIPSTNCL